MSNILKPIGFVLILGAVGAGAYFLGQSSGQKNQVAGTNTKPKPGMVQQVKDFVSGDSPAAGQASPAPAPAGPDPDAVAQTLPPPPKAVVKPRVAASAAITVPAQVTAISGDTVLTKAQVQVHLIGVRTPVKGAEVAQARADLAKLLEDGTVKLQFTSEDHTVAYVWKGNRLLNESMVALGWSRAGDKRFLTAEAAARTQGVGLWSPEGWMGVNP